MIDKQHIENGGFKYLTSGKGKPIIILHGLMGGLGNFEGFISYFPTLGYQVYMPELPIYTASLLDTNVKYFANFINNFIKFLKLDQCYFNRKFSWRTCWASSCKAFPKMVARL